MVGGKSVLWKKLLFSTACLLIALITRPVSVSAVGGLDLAQDTVGTLAPGYSAVHDIFFVLPTNAQQMTPSDWIVVSMPNFTLSAGPNTVLGSYGTPNFAYTAHQFTVTNISLLPGTGMHISGATAGNPPVFLSNNVIIQICDDASCTTVRNQATVQPTTGGYIATVSAAVQSPLSGVSISGHTSPSSFVTLLESGSVIGTTVATNNGFFNFTLNGVPPGAHSYSVYSTDPSNRSSSIAVINVFLIASNVTTVSNILLSPSIQIDKTSIAPGDTITVSGSAVPNLQINIVVQSPSRSYTATANASGNWTYTIPGSETTQYTPGQYQVYAIAQDNVGNQSQVSPTVNFSVTVASGSNPFPNCDISHGDLNCDSRVNLTDFSILLFYWQTNQHRADINNDGHVNLTDFSIMMFYYSR